MNKSVKAIAEKYKEKNKEVEEYLRSQGDLQYSFTFDHVKMLVNSGHMPKKLGDWFFKNHKEQSKRHIEMHEFKKNNLDMSEEEVCKHFLKKRDLSTKETVKFYENMVFSGQFYMCLIKNRHLLTNKIPNSTEQTQALFKNINEEKEFGITGGIANTLYHLENLLKNIKSKKLYDHTYEAKGSCKNKQGEIISLTYSFQASTEEEAEKKLMEYKTIVITKGLKVLFAHWAIANKQGRFEYTCRITDIMKTISNKDRKAFFSTKEKEEHWAITKILEKSKLKRERKIRRTKRGKNKKNEQLIEMVQWIEQPLIEIIGGEKEISDNYPISITARVLMPKIGKKGFSPSIYQISTLFLRPSDFFLSFKIQTRATQRNWGKINLHFDWDFIIEAGNLQTTALSNKRGAKAKAKKKMDRLKEKEVIEHWNEEIQGICVTPKKQKIKKKPETNKDNI